MGVWLTSLIPPGAFVSSLITYNPDFGGFITIQAPPGVPLNQIVLNANVLVGGDLTVNRAVNAVFYQLNDGTGAGADTSISRLAPNLLAMGNGTDGDTTATLLLARLGVGIGSTLPTATIHAASADNTLTALFAGESKAVRIEPTAAQVSIDAVDSTGVTSYQPLVLNGSSVAIANNGIQVLVVAGNVVTIPTLSVGTIEVTSPQTYTPTFTVIQNVSSVVPTPSVHWVYSQVGSVVTVCGQFDAAIAGVGANSAVLFTLPVPAAFGASTNSVSGTTVAGPSAGNGPFTPGRVTGDPGSHQGFVVWYSTDTGTQTFHTIFQYDIN